MSQVAPTSDHAAFVRQHTRAMAVPHAPEIVLLLAEEATPLWLKTEEELGKLGLPPPFWAFAWAGGQALARYLLDHPGRVTGQRVLDFASGSGLVAIAAVKAGAARVEACDIDAFACAAVVENAKLNDVSICCRHGDLIGQDHGWNMVLAGDIAYERETAGRVFTWLQALHRRGATVLVGDPGRAYLPKTGLRKLASYGVKVTRELEDSEIKNTQVYEIYDEI